MKLLVVTNLFPNSRQPKFAAHNFQRFTALSRLCELKVVAPVPFFRYSAAQLPFAEKVGGIDTFHPRYLVIPKLFRFTYGLAFFIGVWRVLKDIYRSFQYDVILTAWAYPDAFGMALAAGLLKKRFFVIVQGSDINLAWRFRWREPMIAWAINKAERVIAVSHPLKQKLIMLGIPAYKIVVLQNGVNTEMFYPRSRIACREKLGLQPELRYILYVGNFAPVKGVSYLIKAFSLLIRDGDVRLILVGEGKKKAFLSSLAAKLGLSDRIIFTGSRPHEEIPDWMGAADVFCLPSLDEGCPNVLLEALACGVQIVASNVGGVPDIIDLPGKGWLVAPGDSSDLARGLSSALKGTSLPGPVKMVSWDEHAARILDVIDNNPSQETVFSAAGLVEKGISADPERVKNGMKLLVVTNLFPNACQPDRAVYNFQQFSALSNLCELKVVAPVPYFQRSMSKLPKVEKIGGIEVFHPRYLVIPKILRFIHGLTFFLGIWRTLRDLKKIYEYDTILSAWAYPDAVGSALAAKLLKKKFFVMALGSDINLASQYWGRPAMIRWALKQADKVVAVSHPLKESIELLGIPAERIVVLANGVDTKRFYPRSQDECRKKFGLDLAQRYVLYVGNFARVKGVSYLVEAFALLVGALDARLLLVGDGEERKSLVELAAYLGVGDRVLFIGRRPHEEIPEWMCAADIFCLPSLNEGCPNVLLEALVCGTKVVASNVGGVPDIINTPQKGWMVKPKDAGELARAIYIAIESPARAANVRVSSWQENAGQLFKILAQE